MAGYPTVMPYLCVDGADDAIAFYTEVLGARERMRMPGPDGRIGHAELEIGDGLVMLADEWPEGGFVSPKTVGGTSVAITVYVDDADAVYERAVARGADGVRPVELAFYGDRAGTFLDPWGHRWDVHTHVEDVSPEEMARRAAELAEG